MSREVELKNIQMTVTTPEDTQISLGALGADNTAASTSLGAGYSLAGNTGVLVKNGGTNVDDVENLIFNRPKSARKGIPPKPYTESFTVFGRRSIPTYQSYPNSNCSSQRGV